MNKRKLTVAIAALGIGIGLTGTAQAGAYAYSYDRLNEGFINSATPASLFFGPPSNTSADSATLNGSGPANSSVGAGLRDAAPAQINIALPNNTWGKQPIPPASGLSFSRGDAQIEQEQTATGTTPGTGIRARNVAESFVFAGDTATASGNNSSGTLLTATIGVTALSAITFTFDFEPLLCVSLNPNAAPGSDAKAVLSVSFTLTPQGGGFPLFIWAPDGFLGPGIFGGIEASDPFSLNLTLEQQVPGSQTYDPSLGGALANTFSATTFAIPTGLYTLTLSMGENTSVIKVVPEPATLILMATGLLGIGFGAKRRKA